VKAGGDSAGLAGICKAVIEADDRAQSEGGARVIDVAFIDERTTGVDAFAIYGRNTGWEELEQVSGLPREALIAAADECMRANAALANYGMGLTHHRMGVQNVRMIVNLLLCAAISASLARVHRRSADIRTCKASARSASRKSRRLRRSTNSRSNTISSHRATKAWRLSTPARV
jgi:hypothetical protein